MIDFIQKNYIPITCLLLVSIATLSLWPADYLPKVPGTDKSHHFIAYAALIFPTIHKKLRRATLPNFPYSIIFEIHEPDVILVLAVAHQKRSPNRWMNR